MALQAAGIPDILAAGLQELGEGKVTDLTTDTQEFVAYTSLMKKPRIEIMTTGYGIQWDLIVDQNNSARGVGLYSTDNVNVPNVLTQGSIPWRHAEASYAFDYHEIDMNQGAREIVRLIKVRRQTALMSVAEYFEDRFWRLQPSTDTTNMFGVPYWIVKSNTEGFNGTVPSGYTTVAGLSPTLLPRWANYTGQYTTIDVTDLIPLWERAADKTRFMPPVKVLPDFNTGDKYGFYTTYPVYQASKQVLRSQNDDLGTDLDPYDGRPTFRRTPITWVPKLDQDTTDPIYGINWGEFKLAVLRNWWMKETILERMPGQHNVSGVFLDCSLNTLLRNRRRCFVLAKNTGLPQ